MFQFIDRHKYGLLGTILLHFFFIFGSTYVRLPQTVASKELVIELSFVAEEVEEQDIPKEENTEEKSTSNSNKAVNERAPEKVKSGDYNEYNREPSETSKKSFEQQLEEELKALEEQVIKEQREAGYGYSPEEVDKMLQAKKNTDLADVVEKEPRSESAFKGSTNITYKLKNRYDTKLEVPVYMCQYGGIVVVNIAVDKLGKVVSAKVDVESSRTTDSCLLNAALKSAKKTHFNKKNDASRIQMGSITYVFIEQ